MINLAMLLRFATASVTPDQRMLACLEALVKAEVFTVLFLAFKLFLNFRDHSSRLLDLPDVVFIL